APTANFRPAGAAAARAAGEGSLAFFLATGGLTNPADVAQSIVEGALLASYNYKYRSSTTSLDVVPVGVPLPTVSVHDEVTRGVERGVLVADAVNWAKYLVDSPAGEMSPRVLASEFE